MRRRSSVGGASFPRRPCCHWLSFTSLKFKLHCSTLLLLMLLLLLLLLYPFRHPRTCSLILFSFYIYRSRRMRFVCVAVVFFRFPLFLPRCVPAASRPHSTLLSEGSWGFSCLLRALVLVLVLVLILILATVVFLPGPRFMPVSFRRLREIECDIKATMRIRGCTLMFLLVQETEAVIYMYT